MTPRAPEPIDLALLDRFFADSCSPQEEDAVRRWIALHPSHHALVTSLRCEFAIDDHLPRPLDQDVLLAKLKTKIQGASAGSKKTFSQKARQLLALPQHGWLARAPRVAAHTTAMLLVGMLAVLAWKGLQHRFASASIAQTAGREYVTQPGQRAELHLADGSTVTLAPTSRLRVPEDFGVATRDLYLVGEAYFDVRHDATRSFRVHTALSVTQDIGTRFSVRSYAGDTTERVVVAEGSIALTPRHDSVYSSSAILTAAHIATVFPNGDVTTVTVSDVTQYLAWINGRLIFKRAPLRDVVPELSRWYGLDIRLSDPVLGDRLLTATFKDESVPEILRLLESSLAVRAEQQGDVVTLTR